MISKRTIFPFFVLLIFCSSLFGCAFEPAEPPQTITLDSTSERGSESFDEAVPPAPSFDAGEKHYIGDPGLHDKILSTARLNIVSKPRLTQWEIKNTPLSRGFPQESSIVSVSLFQKLHVKMRLYRFQTEFLKSYFPQENYSSGLACVKLEGAETKGAVDISLKSNPSGAEIMNQKCERAFLVTNPEYPNECQVCLPTISFEENGEAFFAVKDGSFRAQINYDDDTYKYVDFYLSSDPLGHRKLLPQSTRTPSSVFGKGTPANKSWLTLLVLGFMVIGISAYLNKDVTQRG